MLAVGLNRATWNDALSRGHYTEAPHGGPGRPRLFDRDDLVALFCLDHYTRLGLAPRIAGRVASGVRKYLRRRGADALAALYIITTKDGTPHRVSATKPEGLWHHEIPVAQLRRKIEAIFAERSQRQ